MREKLMNIINLLFDTRFEHGQEELIKPELVDKWDSLTHLSLVICLEDEFGIMLEPGEIADMLGGFNHIADVLNKKGVL